jgi:hypothetical protein
MVESLYLGQGFAADCETRIEWISQHYSGGWSYTYNGMFADGITSVLNEIGVRTYAAQYVGSSSVYDYLSYYARRTTPVIVHIKWGGGGGHFVVCPQVYDDGTAVFLDPWYGLVEATREDLPYYQVANGTGICSGWLNITY